MLKKLCLFLISVSLAMIFTHALANENECHSFYQDQTFTNTQLKIILENLEPKEPVFVDLCDTTLHGLNLNGLNLSYISFMGSDLSQTSLQKANLTHANLTKAYLVEASLQEANLQYANLEKARLENAKLNNANLRQADLNHANLMNADLSGANLIFANLKGANLQGANLTGAQLNWVDLSETNLTDAILTQTNLESADFTRAKLIRTILTGAKFTDANLYQAFYQPKLNTLPELLIFPSVKNFQTTQFSDFNLWKANLTELRAAFKELGIRSMDRLMTATIKYQEMRLKWQQGGWSIIDSAFNYVFFYLTCNFGVEPGRPLRLFLLGIFLFAIPYRYALSYPTKQAGIIAIWHEKRFQDWDKVHFLDEKTQSLCKLLSSHCLNKQKGSFYHQFHLLQLSLFFSLLSAFSIGWKDINVSNWISHLQAREITLKGKGWVRAMSGFQSLFSAYMIVLWVFTYFASLFEW